MKKWFRKNGYDLDKIPETSYQAIINFDDKPLPKSNEYAHNAISAYFSDMERENLRADVYADRAFLKLSQIGVVI